MDTFKLNQWVKDQLEENNHFLVDPEPADLELLVKCIDLTSLNSTDNPESIQSFVQEGRELCQEAEMPDVAAICVYPNFASEVKELLAKTDIKTACVAAAFPHGQAELSVRITEIEEAVKAGADEIDIVINRGLVLSDNWEDYTRELQAMRLASKGTHLKVILEVSDLEPLQIFRSALIAAQCGADFIKTSTGKGSGGATLSSVLIMCRAIDEYYQETDIMVGLKASGGIRTPEEAASYLYAVKTILGEDWMDPKYFRIGASSLLKNILMANR